jgi:hypothetical protein
MLGEFLWQVTSRGQTSEALIPTCGSGSGIGTQAPVCDLLTTQPDEIFIPHSWEVVGLPVVGVTRLLWLIIYAIPISLITEKIIPIEIVQVQADSATSPSQRFARSNNNLVIPPNYIIRANANYDLINAGNFVSARIYGFKMTKGNLVST